LLLRALTVALRLKRGGKKVEKRAGSAANDEWKMCGKLLRQNSGAAAKEILKS